jgi:hypothetical protein
VGSPIKKGTPLYVKSKCKGVFEITIKKETFSENDPYIEPPISVSSILS